MTAPPIKLLPGWEQLRHGGLLFDEARLQELAGFVPNELYEYKSQKLRQLANGLLEGEHARLRSKFVIFVLDAVCGLDGTTGHWQRGGNVDSSWGRRTMTGEAVRPNHVWKGHRGGILPVFIDEAPRLGVGRGRRAVSRSLGWLRAGGDTLAILTNGRQWRLIFAGLDHEAWCEWDLELWFQEGELTSQVTALRTLIQAKLLDPVQSGTDPLLLKAIRDSRKGQADLSEALGERVRQAVEILIQSHGDRLGDLDESVVHRADIYRAACRIAMRLVVILFAESRELLPTDNSLFHGSYSLNGLIEQLERRSTHNYALANSFAAWPRLLALFKLVYEGSHHPDLSTTAYGGGLFAPGKRDSEESISVALSVFERTCFEKATLPDQDVLRILRSLTRTTVRIRQGRGTSQIEVPVDFSTLSSEYIGVLYEGLLDYELKTAPPDTPVIFLAVGKQPAIPLSTLEDMSDTALKTLFKKLDKAEHSPEDGNLSGSGEESSFSEDTAPVEAEEPDAERSDAAPVPVLDDRQHNQVRAERWARRAVTEAKLVKRPRGRLTLDQQRTWERKIEAKARQLIERVILPRGWYLVRWGGTRKGSGSFYTRPGLAVPTVMRTLHPLAYLPLPDSGDAPTLGSSKAEWVPKLPEQILGLTVCDPACGSGTFPLAVLRFLTDALYLSLQVHDRIIPKGEHSVIQLGSAAEGRGLGNIDASADELIAPHPDDDEFESRLRAVLRRHIVERCIYAVDIDPLAVELCRLSLWIETMDRNLPFGFLDHKIKCGNALIGTWMNHFAHYPVMAWKNRVAGDSTHSTGYHFMKNVDKIKIKDFLNQRLKPDLERLLQTKTLFQEDILGQVASTQHRLLSALEKMHKLPVSATEQRLHIYRALEESDDLSAIKRTMNLWCSCWFWPIEHIDDAPLPTDFGSPQSRTVKISEQLSAQLRFFHWELEFPDVFQSLMSGFSAIVGNPPWEVSKPESMEFFTMIDPLYRTYGNQEALRKQVEYFKQSSLIEREWLDYNAYFRAHSNFISYSHRPFGDPNEARASRDRFAITRKRKSNAVLHDRWRIAREGFVSFCDPSHPFRHQGSSDLNSYKLFLEMAHSLLECPRECGSRPVSGNGRLGFVVPSGIHSDFGSRHLRDLFLDNCSWEWLFGFENRSKIFPIHSSAKFDCIIIAKGGYTDSIWTAFMCRDLTRWERGEELVTSYSRGQVKDFSPITHAILELQTRHDLEIVEKIYANAVLLGDRSPKGWDLQYSREFDTTNDSKLFPPRQDWERDGYIPDEYSRWIKGKWRPIGELIQDLRLNQLISPSSGDGREYNRLVFEYNGGSIHSSEDGGADTEPRRNPFAGMRRLVPAGVILSRCGELWISESDVCRVARPVYEGRMIDSFDFSAKRWVSGKGRSADWRQIPWHCKEIHPQFLMDSGNFHVDQPFTPKLGFMGRGSATNSRTAVSALLFGVPTIHSIQLLRSSSIEGLLTVSGIFNSLVFDYLTRARLAGLNLDYHVVAQNPLPDFRHHRVNQAIAETSARLSLSSELFAPYLIAYNDWGVRTVFRTPNVAERSRLLAILNALVGLSFSLDYSDMTRIIGECDYPREQLRRGGMTGSLNPKGFWRVESHLDPELRYTVLSLVAFRDLGEFVRQAGGDTEAGVQQFMAQNDGDGWMLPDELRLSDYDFGRDSRASILQPVACRLGARFFERQSARTVDEYWEEVHLHARNVLGAVSYCSLVAHVIYRHGLSVHDAFEYIVDESKQSLVSSGGYSRILESLASRGGAEADLLLQLARKLRRSGHLDNDSFARFLKIVEGRGSMDSVDEPSVGQLPLVVT